MQWGGCAVLNFRYDDEQQLLNNMVARFVADRFDPAARPAHIVPDEGFDERNWRMLGELGLLALPFTDVSGGLNGSDIDIMIVAEELGRGVSAEPWLSSVLFAGRLMERAGTDAQRAQWLPALMSGEAHLAVAFAEPGRRFALHDPSTTEKDGRLSGTKTFVAAGTGTDAFIVSATCADGSGRLFLVSASAAGIARRDYRLIDGSAACELIFDDTSAEAMAGGIDALAGLADWLAIPIAAELIGLMDVLFTTTLDYVRTRHQFGSPIGSFQAVQHRLADQYLALEQAKSLLLRAVLSEGESAGMLRLAAKSRISAAAVALGEEAIQLHGGMGITDELIIGHAHKRVLLLASLLGDSDHALKRYNELRRATPVSATG
jgi:alkylation response protein AidB-like acyl-CoA dehydrogenase